MEHLRQYFDHLLAGDDSRSSPLDCCQNLFLIGACLSKKPDHILQLGTGADDVTAGLMVALRHNRKGELICVDNRFDPGAKDAARIERLRAAGVRVVKPPSILEYIKTCPADTYDFLISEADCFGSEIGLNAHLRIARDKAFMFFWDIHPGGDRKHLKRIATHLKARGLYHYHFSEQRRPDEQQQAGWLFAINDSAKMTSAARAFRRPGRSESELQRPDDARLKQETLDQACGDMLYLGLVSGQNYGWGVCSQYLIQELARKTKCQVLDDADRTAANRHLNGKLFQALTSGDFFAMFENARGKENYGYTFFENELSVHSVENAKKYDLVLAGSSWCRDRMLEKGIANAGVLIQGVDPAIFYPITSQKSPDNFVIFSGGKFELRKGQDLVLQALKILQQKYADIILVNCWYNKWPQSAELMRYSKHLRFECRQTDSWRDLMHHTYKINGLDATRIVTFELVPNDFQREIYKNTDLGIFPNRCEGGTNLVLMEYMACGKPAIVSNTSGHQDIAHNQNTILLNDMQDLHLFGADNELAARWQEPSVDELIAKIEYAYHHREDIQRIGRRAGEDLKNFTWEKSAQSLLDTINR